jgi:tRNA threonylcarbamoyladenosine biosynthesis protein TsaB
MVTLAIEASTYAGSVAVIRDGVVVAEGTTAMRGEREERLMPAVADALMTAGVAPNALDRVVCGAGPGSFTSLRIAGAIAKGLALVAAVPLYPVSSLLLLVAGARPALAPGRYVAATDAMRGDVFAAAFTVTDASIAVESPTTIVAKAALEAFAREQSARLVGPDQPMAIAPHARGAAALGSRIEWPPPADLASWEPTYGRLAEAQVRWEAAHGRALTTR